MLSSEVREQGDEGYAGVDRQCDPETHPTVFQLTSSVSSVLRDSTRLSEVLGATFPPGSMTGAPKVRSVELLSELEDGNARGYYSGTIGHLNSEGQRTCRGDPGGHRRRETTSYGGGGAATATSDPVDDLGEVLAKTAALAKALGFARPG